MPRPTSPGLAETFTRLIDLGEAEPGRPQIFDRVQFEGFRDPDGTALTAALTAAPGRDGILTRGFPWWLMRVLAPFGGFPREAVDILPIWRHPMRLVNGRLLRSLGTEPRTPSAQAMRATLERLGCRPEPAGAAVTDPA